MNLYIVTFFILSVVSILADAELIPNAQLENIISHIKASVVECGAERYSSVGEDAETCARNFNQLQIKPLFEGGVEQVQNALKCFDSYKEMLTNCETLSWLASVNDITVLEGLNALFANNATILQDIRNPPKDVREFPEANCTEEERIRIYTTENNCLYKYVPEELFDLKMSLMDEFLASICEFGSGARTCSMESLKLKNELNCTTSYFIEANLMSRLLSKFEEMAENKEAVSSCLNESPKF